MLTLIRCPFHPVLPQWHVKDTDNSAKSAGGRVQLNTHILDRAKSEWADYAAKASGKRAHTQLVRERSATVVSTALYLPLPPSCVLVIKILCPGVFLYVLPSWT